MRCVRKGGRARLIGRPENGGNREETTEKWGQAFKTDKQKKKGQIVFIVLPFHLGKGGSIFQITPISYVPVKGEGFLNCDNFCQINFNF